MWHISRNNAIWYDVIVSEGSELKDTFLPIVSQITRIDKNLFKRRFSIALQEKECNSNEFWHFYLLLVLFWWFPINLVNGK